MRITSHSTTRFPCGSYFTFVGPWGSKEFQLFCKRWRCPICRPIKIEEYLADISYAMTRLGGAHLFVATRSEEGKRLSKFAHKNVTGDYAIIKTSDGATIIATRTFPGAKRREKKKYLEADLLELLSSPWSRGRRVSFSSGISFLLRGCRNRYRRDAHQINWARVSGKRHMELEKLATDEERALWLSNNRYDAEIYQEGERFLEETIQRIPEGTQLVELIELREQKEREEQKRRWRAVERSIKNGSLRW